VNARGRPKLGSYRLETMLQQAALDELKRREEKTDVHRTRICAAILCEELIGNTSSTGSPRPLNL
jgi:hypothetical protein